MDILYRYAILISAFCFISFSCGDTAYTSKKHEKPIGLYEKQVLYVSKDQLLNTALKKAVDTLFNEIVQSNNNRYRSSCINKLIAYGTEVSPYLIYRIKKNDPASSFWALTILYKLRDARCFLLLMNHSFYYTAYLANDKIGRNMPYLPRIITPDGVFFNDESISEWNKSHIEWWQKNSSKYPKQLFPIIPVLTWD